MRSEETCSQRNVRLFGTESPVAIVTGSRSARVGRVIAEHLLAQQFRIVLHEHRPRGADDKPLPPALADALVLSGTVEDEQTVQAWVEQVLGAHGRADVLVNSAAIWQPQDLATTTSANFDQFYRVNSLGTALTCQHFGLAMTRQDTGGAIVNLSDWAVQRPYRDFAAYFLSKGSLQTLTRCMAVELGTRNPRVRVNAVLPGPVKYADELSDEKRQQVSDDCLLRREGTAEDVAEAVGFLATAPFVTGVCLPVDGGRSIFAGGAADSVAHPDI